MCLCVHITFNPDQTPKEEQDQALNIHVYVSTVFLEGTYLSLFWVMQSDMCFVCVYLYHEYVLSLVTVPTCAQEQSRKQPRKQNPVDLDLFSIYSYKNKLMKLSLGSHVWNMILPFSVPRCIFHIHFVSTEFTFCSAARFWAITCLIWST